MCKYDSFQSHNSTSRYYLIFSMPCFDKCSFIHFKCIRWNISMNKNLHIQSQINCVNSTVYSSNIKPETTQVHNSSSSQRLFVFPLAVANALQRTWLCNVTYHWILCDELCEDQITGSGICYSAILLTCFVHEM